MTWLINGRVTILSNASLFMAPSCNTCVFSAYVLDPRCWELNLVFGHACSGLGSQAVFFFFHLNSPFPGDGWTPERGTLLELTRAKWHWYMGCDAEGYVRKHVWPQGLCTCCSQSWTALLSLPHLLSDISWTGTSSVKSSLTCYRPPHPITGSYSTR